MVRRAVPVLLAGFCGLGYTQLRGLILNCGATSEEATGRLPGDELLEKADGVSTRAIEIDAPASAVWPWLAQLGPSPRGGAYTYDWIENLVGLNMHSADRVLPEFQNPAVGDTIGFGSNHASNAWNQNMCSPGAARTATGCGRSYSSRSVAKHDSSAATALHPRLRHLRCGDPAG